MEKQDITEQIIAATFEVHNNLGAGFLEKVYENALKFELETKGFEVKQQYPINVLYKNKIVGEYFADLLVNGEIILELKAVEKLAQIHEVQTVNYLKGTMLDVGLLINFGSSVTIKRKHRVFVESSKRE